MFATFAANLRPFSSDQMMESARGAEDESHATILSSVDGYASDIGVKYVHGSTCVRFSFSMTREAFALCRVRP